MEMIAPDVWRVSQGDGPRIFVLGGVHGNEVTGVMLVRRLKDAIERGEVIIERGSLTLALGNPRAIELGTRGAEPHQDLNRVFTEELLASAAVSEELVRARLLAPLLKEADVVLDLHATNKPSVPFLCVPSLSDKHAKICDLFLCENILEVPENIIAGTTIGFAEREGAGVGICYESGWVEDLSRVEEMYESVIAMLALHGMTQGDGRVRAVVPKRRYQLVEVITLTEEGFAYAQGRGRSSFEAFAQGDTVGYHGERPVLAEYDGVLMFPKVPELWKVGSPVGFMARASG